MVTFLSLSITFICEWFLNKNNVGPYEIRDNENADGITELDNKNGINWFFFYFFLFFFIKQEIIKSNKVTI